MTDFELEHVDGSPFHPTGPSYTYDAHWLARGIGSALIAADPEIPAVQLEIHHGGALIVGTDSYSLLTAWVPNPEPGGCVATKDANAPCPELDEFGGDVYTLHDPDGALARWCAFYAKAGHAKINPREQATITLGKLDRQDQPALADDLEPLGIHVGGGSIQAVLPAQVGPQHDWRHVADTVTQWPTSTRAVLLAGNRAAQLGRLAALVGEDRTFELQPRTDNRTGGSVVAVTYSGFPTVAGYIASPRRPDQTEEP